MSSKGRRQKNSLSAARGMYHPEDEHFIIKVTFNINTLCYKCYNTSVTRCGNHSTFITLFLIKNYNYYYL